MGFFTDKYGTAGSQPVTSTTTQPSGGGYFTKKYGTPGNPPVATQTELPATTAPLPTSNKSWLQKIGGFFKNAFKNESEKKLNQKQLQ
jgi:hypothetical protein